MNKIKVENSWREARVKEGGRQRSAFLNGKWNSMEWNGIEWNGMGMESYEIQKFSKWKFHTTNLEFLFHFHFHSIPFPLPNINTTDWHNLSIPFPFRFHSNYILSCLDYFFWKFSIPFPFQFHSIQINFISAWFLFFFPFRFTSISIPFYGRKMELKWNVIFHYCCSKWKMEWYGMKCNAVLPTSGRE